MSDSQSSTTKRCITAEDLYHLHWVSDPAIHPVSGEIAYVEQHINKDRTDYNSGIWLLSSEVAVPIPFTYGPKDETPVWSPDGSQLAFLRTTDGKRQVWIIPERGGRHDSLHT
ncbi:hypothetical protein LWE69_00025 [Paenibacillus sp. UKAQ_18]|nr:hypothetical protein [Paenibacillus sp. UKAQ_18]